MRRQFLMVLAAGVLLAADKDDTKKELDKFQGSWKFESIEVEGMKMPADALKDVRLVLKGDHFSMKEGTTPATGTFKVDVSKKPKTIDISFEEGPDKGQKLLGI